MATRTAQNGRVFAANGSPLGRVLHGGRLITLCGSRGPIITSKVIVPRREIAEATKVAVIVKKRLIYSTIVTATKMGLLLAV